MASGGRTRWDVLAVIAAVITLVMLGVYIGMIAAQGGHAAVWFVAGLVVAALFALYGSDRSRPVRVPLLAVSGVLLVVLGFLGILSIGFPILAAGVLALIAAGLGRRAGPA